MLDVTLTLLADAPRPLKHRDRVRFHIGTSEIMGRVILLDRDEVQPGEEVFAQLHLEESAVAAPQDRYVLRSYSPIQTIAGGMILNTVPAKHRRRRPHVLEQLAILRDGTAADVLAVHLANAEYAGLQWSDCLLRSPLDEAALRSVLERPARARYWRALLTTPRRGFCTGSNTPGREPRYCSCSRRFTAPIPSNPRCSPRNSAVNSPAWPRKCLRRCLQDLTASGEIWKSVAIR